MRPRRRFWVVAGLGAFLALWAVALAQPLALAGAVGVGGWLLAQQYRFVKGASAALDGLTIGHSPVDSRVTAGETTEMTLVAQAGPELTVEITVQPAIPAGAEASTRPSLTLGPGRHSGVTGYDVDWRVAGDYTFDPPTARLRDGQGLFEATVTAGPTTTVAVEPRAPRDLHVGEGGEQVPGAYGEHAAGRMVSGIEPSSVRPYVPGDAVRQIDWKATARLGEPHVREFLGETDRVTAMFVDHRAAMGEGPPGEHKLDFARQVAIAFLETARALSDPIGCYTVGDEGLTSGADPGASVEHLRTVRNTLEDLEPTGGRISPEHAGGASAAQAQRLRTHIDEGSAFGRRLRPFLASPDAYVERVADKPLFRTVESVTSRLGTGTWTVILTDDSDRPELRETVKVASRSEGGVLVFLTPTVLFDTDDLITVESAYDGYVEFESFRRELAGYPDVWVFEVGPGERLSSVLAAGDAANRTANAGGWGE